MMPRIRRRGILLLSLMICTLVPLNAVADSIDDDSGSEGEAEEVLRSMTRYLGGLSAFNVEAEIDNELLSTSGEKIHLSSSGRVAMKRPNQFYMSRHGGIANLEMFFDGKQITLHGKNLDIYAQVEIPGNIDDALEAARIETGFDLSGADLFYSDAYAGLMSDVASSEYRGTGIVNGVECHHLSFRAKRHDWQIWIQAGDQPLPMKFVIISKWVTAAPQYVVRFDDWNTNPQFDSKKFQYTPGPNARRLDSLPVDESGEIILGEIQ